MRLVVQLRWNHGDAHNGRTASHWLSLHLKRHKGILRLLVQCLGRAGLHGLTLVLKRQRLPLQRLNALTHVGAVLGLESPIGSLAQILLDVS